MALETITNIASLNASNPTASDDAAEGDDHIRGLKTALLTDFPNFGDTPLAATQPELDAAATAVADGEYPLADGTASLPSLYHLDDENTGVYFPEDDKIGLTAGGTEIVEVASTGLDIKSGNLLLAGANPFPVAAANVAADAIETAKIVDKAVTYAKLQDVTATSKLLGRYSALAGVVEEIGLDASLSITSGGNLKVTDAPIYPLTGTVNLKISNDSSDPDTIRTITADEAVLVSTAGVAVKFRAVDQDIDYTEEGAGGLDTGTVDNNEKYSQWLISTGTDIAGIASLSPNSPTMPTGYTYKALVGWCSTDADADLRVIKQVGKRGQYKTAQSVDSGTAGTYSSSTFSAVSISPYVPGIAKAVFGHVTGTGSASFANAVAPNSDFTNHSGDNPAPVIIFGSGLSQFDFILESANIYWIATNASSEIFIHGFELP